MLMTGTFLMNTIRMLTITKFLTLVAIKILTDFFILYSKNSQLKINR